MTNSEMKKVLDEVGSIYDEETLEYWESIETYIISTAKNCCSTKYFSWDELDDLIMQSTIILYELNQKLKEQNKTANNYYIITVVKNFFINTFKERRRKTNKVLNDDDLKALYGEDEYFNIICKNSTQTIFSSVEESLVYSPLIDKIEADLNDESKDVLHYILENQDITPKLYAKIRGLKPSTALKRIQRFRKTIKNKMLIWGEKNKEEVELMGEVFWYLHSFHIR